MIVDRRAVLMAHKDRQPEPPRPTHDKNALPMYDKAPIQRWVTVAKALGWHSIDDYRDRINDQSQSGEIDWEFPFERPATTIAGRPFLPAPGANANRFNGKKKSRNDGIRLTVSEMGVLQSFPADYPWCGTKAEQATQAGNAIPPLMARAILAQLVE